MKRKFKMTVILRQNVEEDRGVEEELKIRLLAASEHDARRTVLDRAYQTGYLVSYFTSINGKAVL